MRIGEKEKEALNINKLISSQMIKKIVDDQIKQMQDRQELYMPMNDDVPEDFLTPNDLVEE